MLLEPFMAGLDEQWAHFEALEPPSDPAVVLGAVLALLAQTRIAADVLARDIAARGALGPDGWVQDRSRRLVWLLTPGTERAELRRLRALAAIGAMVRPLADLAGAPVSDAELTVIRAAALGALEGAATARLNPPN